MLPDINNIYNTIIDDICSELGQCVLLLGPEIFKSKSGESYRTYFGDLAENSNEDISYFPNDNLFYFKDSHAEGSLKKLLVEFYKNNADSALIELISKIKFPLIINSFPDTSINETYSANRIHFKNGYFQGPVTSELLYPSKENPVIYNIFGRIDYPQSLILTHGELYRIMDKLMPENSLPPNLELLLDNVNSFLFLGFKFDSWYYQLLCHRFKINGNHSKERKCLSEPNANTSNPVSMLIDKHFKINFTVENPTQIITRLITGIEQKEGSSSKSLRSANPDSKYSVFISYAWEEGNDKSNHTDKELIVDLIAEKLKSNKLINVFRDKEKQKSGDSIKLFMDLIGKGATVIIILSDDYLKSQFCLGEALRTIKRKNSDARVFFACYQDFEINDETAVKYKKYWGNISTEIIKGIDEKFKDIIQKEIIKRDNDTYIDLYTFVDQFVNDFKDKISFRVTKDDFEINEKGKTQLNDVKTKDLDNFVGDIINKIIN